jgi:hypothetical protein
VQWAPGVSCALCFFEGHELQTSGAPRRENAELYHAVIASEAKQYILSLCGEMDCFAPLAMTELAV